MECGHHDHHDEHCCHHEHHDHCCHEHHHEDHDHHCCHDEHCECHHDHHHHHHDADEIFTSYGKESAKSTTLEKLNTFLEALNSNENLGIVLRSKGVIKSRNDAKWYHFDYVSGTYEIREGSADTCSRLVVIGSKLNLDLVEELVEDLLS